MSTVHCTLFIVQRTIAHTESTMLQKVVKNVGMNHAPIKIPKSYCHVIATILRQYCILFCTYCSATMAPSPSCSWRASRRRTSTARPSRPITGAPRTWTRHAQSSTFATRRTVRTRTDQLLMCVGSRQRNLAVNSSKKSQGRAD